MPIKKSQVELREPNRPNRDKSVHSRGAGEAGYVRCRHPESHKQPDDAPVSFPGDDFAEPPCDCPPATDTQDRPLDTFTRIVQTNTYSAGTGSLEYVDQYQLSQTADLIYPHPTGPLSLVSAHSIIWVSSYLGIWYLPWTSKNNTPQGPVCGSFDNYLAGWVEKEGWTKYKILTRPSGLAGITLSNRKGANGSGIAATHGWHYHASASEPTTLRAGTYIGGVPNDGSVSGTMFIPASLVPPVGGFLWIGLVPGWMCSHDIEDYACGWNFPYKTGAYDSGRAATTWLHLDEVWEWQTWDVAEDSFGSPMSGDEAGGDWGDIGAWEVSSTGGTAGIDGHALYYTVAAGAPSSLTMHLPGGNSIEAEDSDVLDYREPWTDELGINFKVRFKLVTAGDVTEAGDRKFTFGWHDTRDFTRGTIYLGDLAHPQGLSLFSDDIESAFVPKDITEGSWHWLRIDTRHPSYTRMKMWTEEDGYGGGEPVAWDIQMTRTDDANRPVRDDFLEMVMALGNMTGSDQSFYVDIITVGKAGLDNQWMVDRMGVGDGVTSTFYTAQPFKPGTLWPFVDGMHVDPNVIDAADGKFEAWQTWPAADKANIVARYIVDDLSDVE